jgi:2-succinyl-5-enolpyruvyl-6-hydroxy-3-cyclohexene-1-carboxylate synthase
MQSPYLAIANKQAQIMTKAAIEMGFTPASRSRISIPNERPGEELVISGRTSWVDPKGHRMSTYAASAKQYAERVVSHEILTCEWVQKACKRQSR